MIDKKKTLDKWKPVLENMGVKDQSKLDWMSEYAEQHNLQDNTKQLRNEKIDDLLENQAKELLNDSATASTDFSGVLFPLVKKVAAQTIAMGNGVTQEDVDKAIVDRERIIRENREGKINEVLFDEEYEVQEVPEIPEIIGGIVPVTPMGAPIGNLMYLDYKYEGLTASTDEK
mgnify:CR=1 FL=1